MGDYTDQFVSLSCWRGYHHECLGYSHRTARGERAPDAVDCHCTCHALKAELISHLGVDNVCDWYYAAPEDRPSVCPTCGEEFE